MLSEFSAALNSIVVMSFLISATFLLVVSLKL